MPGARRGGYSSAGRAPGCGPGGRGFKSRYSPHGDVSGHRQGPNPQGSGLVVSADAHGGREHGPLGAHLLRRWGHAVPPLRHHRHARHRRRLRGGGGRAGVRRDPACRWPCTPGCSSAPKDGATVETAQEVVLTFNEDVNPDFVAVKVTGPAGSETAGKPAVDGTAVTQALAADLPAGKHAVTYRVVSTDGHPVSGTVTFTSTAAPASASPSPTLAPPRVGDPHAVTDRLRRGLTGAHRDRRARLGGLRRRRHPLAGRRGRRPAGRPRARRRLAHHRRPARPTPRRMPRTSPMTTPSRPPTGAPRRPDRFRPDAGRLLMSPSRAISSIGRAADS